MAYQKPRPRAVIYIRLSRNDDDSTSVATQRAVCEEVCARMGWEVVFIAEDLDVSGASRLEQREGMARVLDSLGDVHYVVAAKLDRFARSVLEFSRLMNAADSARTTLITADGTLTAETSKLIVHVLSAFAEYERDMITTRIQESRDRLREQGRWLGGPAPYGYMTVTRDGGKYLVEDPDTGWRVREMVKRVIDGTDIGVLVNELALDGVPSPVAHARMRAGKPAEHPRTKKVPEWRPATLRSLLVSPTLTGTLMHDPRPPEQKKDENGKRIKLRHDELRPVLDDKGEPVKVGPPLITDAEHRAVKAALEGKYTPPRARASASLLLHVAHCNVCGGPLYYNTRRYKSGLVADSYLCQRKAYHKAGTKNVCKVSISAKHLEPLVRDRVMAVLGNLPLMRPMANAPDLAAEISETENGIESLAASLGKLRAGSKAALSVGKQLEALQGKLDRLMASQGAPEGPKWEPTGRTFEEEWEARDVSGRRALLLSVGVRVNVTTALGKARVWDPRRVLVEITGPAWWSDDPAVATLADIAEQEARAEEEPPDAV